MSFYKIHILAPSSKIFTFKYFTHAITSTLRKISPTDLKNKILQYVQNEKIMKNLLDKMYLQIGHRTLSILHLEPEGQDTKVQKAKDVGTV